MERVRAALFYCPDGSRERREGWRARMAIEITRELEELKAQAEGSRPFVVSGLFERLTEKVCTPAYWKDMTATQRLALGYYLATKRRAEMLREG